MGRRAATNKLVLRGIAVGVLLLLLFLLWPASQAVAKEGGITQLKAVGGR